MVGGWCRLDVEGGVDYGRIRVVAGDLSEYLREGLLFIGFLYFK